MNVRRIVCGWLTALLSSLAPAQVVWDNGPFQTHESGGPNNAPLSVVQRDLGLLLLGAGANVNQVDSRIADDFTVEVSNRMILRGIRIYMYTIGATSPTIQSLNFCIIQGSEPTGTIIFGDRTTNRLTQNFMTDVFRVYSDDMRNGQRHIQAVDGEIFPPIELEPGTYLLDFQVIGPALQTFSPPVTILGRRETEGANALQRAGSRQRWNPIRDTNTSPPSHLDFPFLLIGEWGIYPRGTGPDSVQGGYYADGDDSDVRESDDKRFSVVCDEAEPVAVLNLELHCPAQGNAPNALQIAIESQASRDQLLQVVELKNDVGQWVAIDTRMATRADERVLIEIEDPQLVLRFLMPNGGIEARVRWIPQRIDHSVDGWSVEVDQFEVVVRPE